MIMYISKNCIYAAAAVTKVVARVPNFEQKNYFSEDETRRTTVLSEFRLFRKTKTYVIPFRVITQNIKDTGIFVRNHSEAEYF
jgi:hypothetical protein